MLVHPTPVFLPGKSHGQRSLVGYSPKGGLDMTKHANLRISNRERNRKKKIFLRSKCLCEISQRKTNTLSLKLETKNVKLRETE